MQRSRMRVLHDQGIEVVQRFAHQHRDDVRLGDGRIVRPPEHLDDVGGERSPELQRVACLGCPITMDYNPERLNFFFDEATGIIKEVRCG